MPPPAAKPAADVRRAALERAAAALVGRRDGAPPLAAAARAAGVPAPRLRRLFGSLPGFHRALLEHWLEESRDAVLGTITALPAGRARVRRALESWLDANAARPGLRSLMYALRGDPAAGALVQSRAQGLVMLLQLEFAALGWPHPGPAARLYAAAAIEAAVAEFEAGRRLPDIRATLLGAVER